MKISEKVSYIRGLTEGLNLDKNKPEGKIILAILDVLDDISASILDLENYCEDMAEQLDTVDEDLATIESDFYENESLESENNSVFYEVTCPTCNESVCVSESIVLDGNIDCPNCGENLEFDLENLPLSQECDCHTNNECNCDSCDCEK